MLFVIVTVGGWGTSSWRISSVNILLGGHTYCWDSYKWQEPGETATTGSFHTDVNQNWREESNFPAPGRFTERIHFLREFLNSNTMKKKKQQNVVLSLFSMISLEVTRIWSKNCFLLEPSVLIAKKLCFSSEETCWESKYIIYIISADILTWLRF